MFKFELGSKVKDKYTDFVGVIMSRTQYLTGCVRYAVQTRELKDGKPLDWIYFDEDSIELIKEGDQTRVGRGGPMPDPPQR